MNDCFFLNIGKCNLSDYCTRPGRDIFPVCMTRHEKGGQI
jgi:hypothetical protein